MEQACQTHRLSVRSVLSLTGFEVEPRLASRMPMDCLSSPTWLARHLALGRIWRLQRVLDSIPAERFSIACLCNRPLNRSVRVRQVTNLISRGGPDAGHRCRHR
jgi:hypothetical protein